MKNLQQQATGTRWLFDKKIKNILDCKLGTTHSLFNLIIFPNISDWDFWLLECHEALAKRDWNSWLRMVYVVRKALRSTKISRVRDWETLGTRLSGIQILTVYFSLRS